MRRYGNLLVGALVAGLVGSSPELVQAADLNGVHPANLKDDVAPAFTWTGLYIGLNGGGVVDGNANWDLHAPPAAPTPQFDDSIDGWLLGGHLGYNWQWGKLVFGLEGDASGAWIDGSQPCENDATFACQTDIDSLFSIRARLGFGFEKLLVYGTVGWARASLDLKATGPASSPAADDSVDGIVYGGGAEWMALPSVSIGVEALHYDFDGTVGPWVDGGGGRGPGAPDLGDQKFDADFTTVRGRLTYHLKPGY